MKRTLSKSSPERRGEERRGGTEIAYKEKIGKETRRGAKRKGQDRKRTGKLMEGRTGQCKKKMRGEGLKFFHTV